MERSVEALASMVSDPAVFVTQDWGAYSEDDHAVWSVLYERRMTRLQDTGSAVFLAGAEQIGLQQHQVPDLAEVNGRLAPRTGWEAVPVAGYLPPRDFFLCLSRRKFPTTITVRKRAQLDYLPEPDIFHDVFGHVPLHADPAFADFLQHYGEVASTARTEDDVTRMTRLFWFTIEFGLVREAGRIKVYGSGLISSQGDAENALGPKCERRPFSLDGVFAQPFEIDRLQDVLFVTESFSELFASVEEAGRRIASA